MKQLLIIRHAKSSWSFDTLTDFERPLNERGHTDAPKMAEKLLQKQLSIDLIITSTAKRAFTTANYFAELFKLSKENIVQAPNLYHAPPTEFYAVFKNIQPLINTVAIFAHNPGITDFVNQLTPIQIDNMPTCGIFAVQIQTDSWNNFATAPKTFLFFDYPKNK